MFTRERARERVKENGNKTSTCNVETSDNIQRNKRGHLYQSVVCIDFEASWIGCCFFLHLLCVPNAIQILHSASLFIYPRSFASSQYIFFVIIFCMPLHELCFICPYEIYHFLIVFLLSHCLQLLSSHRLSEPNVCLLSLVAFLLCYRVQNNKQHTNNHALNRLFFYGSFNRIYPRLFVQSALFVLYPVERPAYPFEAKKYGQWKKTKRTGWPVVITI